MNNFDADKLFLEKLKAGILSVRKYLKTKIIFFLIYFQP